MKSGIIDRSIFSSWISQCGFKLVTLSDSSVWVLREGVQDESCIHIHPAQNSPNNTRIHGNSWKTVIITKMFNPYFTDMDMSVINEVRVKYLNLSPIKNICNSQRLLTAIKLLRNS